MLYASVFVCPAYGRILILMYHRHELRVSSEVCFSAAATVLLVYSWFLGLGTRSFTRFAALLQSFAGPSVKAVGLAVHFHLPRGLTLQA